MRMENPMRAAQRTFVMRRCWESGGQRQHRVFEHNWYLLQAVETKEIRSNRTLRGLPFIVALSN